MDRRPSGCARRIATFLRSCPLAVRLPGGVFVTHTLPEKVDSQGFDKTIFDREFDEAEFQEHGAIFQLVWGRDYRAENARAIADLVGARIFINGHEPCSEGFRVPNPTQIILDCCGDRACYLILPVDRELSQAEIVRQVQWLG